MAQEEDDWRLQTDMLPTDQRLIPGVGNGHVATQVYSDTIYINNLYNGYTNTSHRARIPSTAAINLVITDVIDTNYTLDMKQGIFVASFSAADYDVEQRIYAHRSRTRVIINEFTVTRKGAATPEAVSIGLELNQGDPSEDMDLTTFDHDATTFYTTGAILDPETYSSDIPIIHQYWTKVPSSVTLSAQDNTRTWRYLTAISIDQSDALVEFESANGTGAPEMLQEHTQSWDAIWTAGDIQVQGYIGNFDLQQTFRAALFHILISTPDSVDIINPFAGLSPGGLARGGQINNMTSAYNDYLGHVFWDMDTWILPSVLMLHPDKAKLMILSRYRVINATRDNANARGHLGIRYPWEQAYTGYETCPWDLAALYQIHVTADVSYSIRQYLYTTEDTDFVNNEGGKEMVMEIARFWESRSVLRDVDKGYEILGVMGPDENSANVNNSVFTNYIAKLSLSLPNYLQDKLGISFTPDEAAELVIFDNVADNMYIPFDEDLQFHPQYDGFDYINSTIKQSDVVLLGYPLMKNMTPEVRRNDLEIYEKLTDKYGPDTGTWSMHTVGWLELDNTTKAEEMFLYMFRNINGPFKIFSEKPDSGPDGMRATNFITLAGGLLQSVFFGYGGIRVREYQMDLKPEILPNTTSWSISGFKYRRSTLDFDFQQDDVTVLLTNQDAGAEQLIMLTPGDGGRYPLVQSVPVLVPRASISIVTQSDELRII